MGSMIGSMAMGGGSMIGGMIGGLIQGYYNDKNSKVMEEYYGEQAKYAREQADEEEERANRVAFSQETQSIEQSRRQRYEDRLRLDERRASQAGSGLSMNIGSPLTIEEENDTISRLNALDIFKTGFAMAEETRYAGQQAKRGLLWEAEQFRFQEKQEKSKRRQNKIMTVANMVAGGAIGISDMYSNYQAQQHTTVGATQANNTYQANTREFSFNTGDSSWNSTGLDSAGNSFNLDSSFTTSGSTGWDGTTGESYGW